MAKKIKTIIPAPVYSLNVNWENYSDWLYGWQEAQAQFKNCIYWQGDSQTYSKSLQVRLARAAIGPSGGVMAAFNVPEAASYQLSFSMKFDQFFDWGKGGKVGFGFLIGKGYTGGEYGLDGASVRIMWKPNLIIPYVYHADQPGQYGDDFGVSKEIYKDTWYQVTIIVKCNTGTNKDGLLNIFINNDCILSRNIRTSLNNALINKVCFENFRGGGDDSWAAGTSGKIYFNNVSWKIL